MNAWAFKLRPIADLIRRKAPTRLGWGALASIPGLALAGPTGENVVAGGAVVSRPSALQTQVDQSTARAVVNWSTFSVDNDEYVVFNQPGATASILNRVVGSNQSRIFGQIEANGRVFLVNPQGVYFAPGAEVDVAGLTASVMDITDNNFMSGNYVFSRPANAPDGATVENAGNINVSDGGFVVLAGDYANNSGVISARLGSVVLAAGSKMTLDLSDDGLVSFAVDEATVSSLAGANNTGQVLADGGQIIMTAKVANDLVATAVNNEGLLQARRIVSDGGEIYLAAAGADIVQAGTIDVEGVGDQSGGEVGITGDADITLAANSVITADGSGAGNGGTVNVIADGTMAFRRDAEITARAGDEGERGGAVELSGYDGIQVRGNLQLGKGGEVVIDPAVVGLVSSSGSYGGSYGSTIGVNFIEGQLNSSADVSILASSAIVASGGVSSVNATSGSGNLTLRVTGPGGGGLISYSLFVGSGTSFTGTVADGNIDLAGVEFDILGDFTASAGGSSGDVNLGKVSANNVRIFSGGSNGSITLNTGGINAASSVLNLSAADDINIGTMANPGGLNLTGGAGLIDLELNAGGDVNVQGNVIATASGSGASATINVDARNISLGNVTATATDGEVDIRLFARSDSMGAGGNITVNHVTAMASEVNSPGGSANIDFGADNDITVNNVTAKASSDSVFVDMDAGNNLVVNGVTTAVAQDEFSISYSAGNNVTINNTINATANSNSYASIDVRAGNNIATRDINATALFSGTAAITIDATSGNVTINGTAKASASGNDGSIDIDAGGNITVGTAATPGGLIAKGQDASIDLFANGKVTVHGAIDASGTSGSGYVEIDAVNNDINIDDVLVYGTNGASVDLSAGRDIIVNRAEAEIGASGSSGGGSAFINFFAERDVMATGKIEAIAGQNSGGALIDIDALGAKLNTKGLDAMAANGPASVELQGGVNTTTINVGGAVNVEGTMAIFSASAFDINLGGKFDLAAPSYITMYANAKNDMTVNGDIDATEGGGGIVDVQLFAQNSTTINGNIDLKAGPGSYAWLDIGAPEESPGLPVNSVNANGNISVKGMLANAFIFGKTVNVPGSVTVSGAGMPMSDIAAGFAAWAVNTLNIGGDVLVHNTVGAAGVQYVSGGSIVVNKHDVTGGPNGPGIALFNAADPGGLAPLPQGFPGGKSVAFNKLFKVTGGQGGGVIADAMNSITSGPGGRIDAKYTDFSAHDNINLVTSTMSVTFRDLGETPNVVFDNRAFGGPSNVNFASGANMKAARFLASGPLAFNGAFTANNLAVGVTNGDVSFNGPVHITGTTPFLPTAPDIALFNLMGQRGLLPPTHGPNVQIFARNGININDPFVVSGPSPFTKMFTNGPFNISGLTTNADNMLAVFSPIGTTRPIFFEDEPFSQPLFASAFFNFPTIQGLPDNGNVTVVLGERGPALPLLSGPLTIGSNGPINIGDRNMFIITRGVVTGEDAVITNGIFEIIGLAQNDVFEVPIVNEFGDDTTTNDEEDDDDDDDDELAFGDDGDDNGDDGGVSEEGSGSESMECST